MVDACVDRKPETGTGPCSQSVDSEGAFAMASAQSNTQTEVSGSYVAGHLRSSGDERGLRQAEVVDHTIDDHLPDRSIDDSHTQKCTERRGRRLLVPTILLACAAATRGASWGRSDGGHVDAVRGHMPSAVAAGLNMGTANPHVLDGEEAEWAPRKGSAFSVLAHARATDDELMSRAMPVMNTPPKTTPKAPPQQQVEEPPIVTQLDQVIPPAAQKKVTFWRRRVQRCIKLAKQGRVREARKMRPPDLWLPSSECQVEATRQWVWDLRPLWRGEPAQVLRASGVDGRDPDTSLVLDALRAARDRATFADKAILDEMIQGVCDDVHEEAGEQGTLLCAPHVSALQNWAVAAERTANNVERMWSYEDRLPCWPMRVCPYGIVDESEREGAPKFRLTNDLSWPPPDTLPAGGGEFVKSHNAAMDRSDWPAAKMLHVKQIAEAAAIMGLAEAPIKLWSIDCEAFYRKMGRQAAEVWRNVMAVEGGFQVDKRCCFGSAADAAKCSRVSNFLVAEAREAMAAVDERYPTRDAGVLAWQAKRRLARQGQDDEDSCSPLSMIGMYVDDAPACSFDDELIDGDGVAWMRDGVPVTRATAHFEAVCEMLLRYGHKSKPSKERRPCRRLEVLGVIIDLDAGRMWLADGKRKSYSKRVAEAATQRTMEHVEYLRLLGRLQFAAALYPLGRQWLHAAWRVARARFRLQHNKVQLTARVRKDLVRWQRELDDPAHEGVPLACRRHVDAWGQPGTGAIYADASGDWGWGAWTVVGRTLFWCGGEWSPEVKEDVHINEKELYASTAGLITLADVATFTSVYNFTDSTAAMGAMRNFTAESPRMQELISVRAEWMLARGVAEAPCRVTSHQNLWADLASRGWSAQMERQAEALGLAVLRVPVVAAMRDPGYLQGLGGGEPC